MVRGVDVWLNNPVPPLEGSGTSGMKASVNGVPNLSLLDGWWIEGYDDGNGWAFGNGANPEDRRKPDAESIYRLIEDTTVPLYYRRSDDEIPHEFVRTMKEAIRTVAPKFSTRRMAKEYATRFYAPALGRRGIRFVTRVCSAGLPALVFSKEYTHGSTFDPNQTHS